MAQEFGPGRDLELTREGIYEAFERSEAPAMTVGDIADHVGPTRQTVHRLLVEEGKAEEWGLESARIGNATAYWRGDSTPEADGGFELFGGPLHHPSFRRNVSRIQGSLEGLISRLL